MTAFNMADSQAYLGQDRSVGGYVTVGVLTPLAFFAVALRLFAGRLCHIGPRLDDWLILLALLATLTVDAMFIWVLKLGLGKHEPSIPPARFRRFKEVVFIVDLLLTFALMFTKLSILAFYRRVFPTRAVRVWSRILDGLVIAWGIAVLVASLLSCTPIQLLWDSRISGGRCVDVTRFWLGKNIIHVVLDGMILALPMPVIWNLQLRLRKKIAISAVFAVGSLDIGLACGRLKTIAGMGTDLSWDLLLVGYFLISELNVAVVTACLPTLPPAFHWAKARMGWSKTESASEASGDVFPRRQRFNRSDTDHFHFRHDISGIPQLVDYNLRWQDGTVISYPPSTLSRDGKSASSMSEGSCNGNVKHMEKTADFCFETV